MSPRILAAVSAAILGVFAPPLQARTWLVDFGPNNNTDGNVTPSGTPVINPGNGSTGVADSNGAYWNNAVGAGGTGGPVAMSYLRLVDTANASTPVGLTLGPGWKSNGKLNGGLLAPDPAKLGNLAIARATEDYFFIDGATGLTATLNLNNLDPGKLYNLRFFGTRATSEIRKTNYTVAAGNGVFSSILQTSGSGLASGTGGNDSTTASFSGLQTDASGQLTLKVAIAEGGFAYLGLLELTEGDAVPPIPSRTVRVDFGKHDVTNGNPTTSPDSFGKHWNNFGQTANGSSLLNLVDTANQPTPLGVTLTASNWENNGLLNGGLKVPTFERLGELAVATATQDYIFIGGNTGTTASMRIRGLSPSRLYSMRFFGSREEAQVRRTTYTITAPNGVFAGTLRTSGAGIGNGLGGADGSDPYNGNNRSTVALGGIQANSAGDVTLQLSIAEGGYAYLGILEIVEGASVPELPPVAITNDVDRWTAQDAIDPVAPGGVLFVGSSSIRRWETLTRDFADYRVVQRGFGGSQFSDLNPIVHRIVTPYQPSAIVVFEGTNDIRGGGKTGEQVFADFQTFVNSVRAQQPSVPICYIGITPTPSFFTNPLHDPRRRTANSLIKAHCENNPSFNLHYLNTNELLDTLHDTNDPTFNSYFVDDTHLSRKGYQHFVSVIRPALAAIIAPNKAAAVNPNALAAGEKLFFDFGPTDVTTGDSTIAPDSNGNHWNNWHLTNGGGTINSGEHLRNLVRSTGTNTGIRMTMTGGFLCNGKASFGGLLAPNPSLLGELAVESATQDFFYSTANDVWDSTSDDVPGGFMLEGLDPSLVYEFKFFGARDNAETRITKYEVFGSNGGQANLTTSGTGIGSAGGNNNDDDVAVISGIRPDGFGQVFIDITLVQGAFAYINSMQVTASAVSTSPWLDWRSANFSAGELGNPELEATLWGRDADPDGDGRSNLLEYALGTNPRESDATPLSFAIETEGDLLTLTYRKCLDATDVSFQVQKSDDLAEWVDVPDTSLGTEGDFETRKASVSKAGEPRLMLRLKTVLAD